LFAAGWTLHYFLHHVKTVPAKEIDNLVSINGLAHIPVHQAILLHHVDTTISPLEA